MKFLFLCTKYPIAEGDSYMTGELADALIGRGHDVDVAFLDWGGSLGGPSEMLKTASGVRVLSINPRAVRSAGTLAFRASKFLLSSRHAERELARSFDLGAYDAAIAWTPAAAVSGMLTAALRSGVRKSILFVFDFFPIHHREIGLVPNGPPYWIAKAWEERLMRRFSAIVCNLPSNAEYLRARYAIRPDQDVTTSPLWARIDPPATRPRAEMREAYGLPQDSPVAIFGGQLTEGRGIDLMLAAASIAEAAGSTMKFVFAGDGRLAGLVELEASRPNSNVLRVPAVDRGRYASLVAACDVGMVATVQGVSSFSFPTKTIDYLLARIPTVAAVEPGSDYLKILSAYGVGEGVPFGDPEAYLRALERQVVRRADADFPQRAHNCLDEVFDVRHTAALIERLVGAQPAK